MFRFFLQTLPPVDTTKIHTFTERLQEFKGMSFQDIISTVAHDLITVAFKIVLALVIFFVGRWLIRRVRRMVHNIFERRDVDLSLRGFLFGLINATLYIILLTIIIGTLGINTTSFVAIFASAGLAVGMALSGTLQNFAGGVMILAFRPYRVGDYIEAQGQAGTVKEIQLFNTVLNTSDNKRIILPNGPVSTGIINNYSREETRRVDWVFGIAYGDSYDDAKAIIAGLLDKDKRVLSDPAYFIALTALADSSVNIVVRAWVQSGDYWGVYFDLNESVYKTFSEKGINIPFPQMDVHLFQQQAAQSAPQKTAR